MDHSVQSCQKSWYADEVVQYNFPGNWQVDVITHKPVKILGKREIYNSILHPVGCVPLKEQLRPDMKVLLVCDDISRPTRTDIILPVVIDILTECGIRDENISVLAATGSHELMNTKEKELKYGKEIIQKYPVHDHNYLRGNVLTGRTKAGTPLWIDKLLVKHDFIIGIGGIYPHKPAGFGGGAKLILGVCGYKSINHFHIRSGVSTEGESPDNEFRKDVMEAARMSKLNFIINATADKEKNITGIFAGDVNTAFLKGMEQVKKIYAVPHPASLEHDVIIADVYPFDTSFAFTRKGWWPVLNCLSDKKRYVISAMTQGTGNHRMFPVAPSFSNKLFKKYLEWRAFGPVEFTNRTILRRVKKTKGKAVNDKTVNPYPASAKKHKIVFLHSHPESSLFKDILNMYEFTNDPDIFMHIDAGKDPVRVAYYQASSLTFPESVPL